ncbi:MAG: efflux RND transporter periplasmic adaptor subunit [Planctomycetes bacterium]|nr:efflux RND transporter periplasmic adaptor subunit [Planctomycetota bacterium]
MQRGEVFYVVKDPDTREYFRFTRLEYTLMRLFDGRASFQAMAERFNRESDETEVDAATLEEFSRGLTKIGVLERTLKEKNLLLLEKRRHQRQSKILNSRGGLLYKVVPLMDPDRLFDRVMPYCRFFFTPWFVALALASMAGASLVIAYNFDEVAQGIVDIWTFNLKSSWAFFTLWATVLVVIALHECAHGMTCKHFGGEVHEIGFLLMFFNPCLYCNVNDAWSFERRRSRLWVVFAGGFFEFFLGSLACYLWWLTDRDSSVHVLAYQVMCVCGFATVLMNFNPLLKYDGYYALSDWLEIPNLKNNSSDYLKHWVKTRVFRMKATPDATEPSRDERQVYLIYGSLCTFYMTSMLVGLFLLAHNFLVTTFYQWGLAGVFILGWVLLKPKVVGLFKFGRDFYRDHREFFMRPYVKYGLGAGVAAGLAWLVLGSAPLVVEATVTLQAGERATIRARIGGVLAEVWVEEGHRVQAGERLLALADEGLIARLKDLEVEERKLELSRSQALARGDPKEAQVLDIRAEDNRRRLRQARADEKDLVLSTPVAGVVMTSGLGERLGQYVRPGEDVVVVADTTRLRVEAEIEQRDVPAVTPGLPVRLFVPAVPDWEPSGALAVAQIHTVARDGAPTLRSFLATLEVDNRAATLRPGMSGQVRIESGRRPAWELALRSVERFFRSDLWL